MLNLIQNCDPRVPRFKLFWKEEHELQPEWYEFGLAKYVTKRNAAPGEDFHLLYLLRARRCRR